MTKLKKISYIYKIHAIYLNKIYRKKSDYFKFSKSSYRFIKNLYDHKSIYFYL